MSNCKLCKSRNTVEIRHWYGTLDGEDMRFSHWSCNDCGYEWEIYERRRIIGYDA